MANEFGDRLRSESVRWVRQGLISTEQQEAILGLYPTGEGTGRDRAVMILSILGSLLVGAGVILYFAANWPHIPAAVRVLLILVATLSSYWAGYYFQYRRADMPRLGQALIFLGGLFYGAGIWLLAQTFHLGRDFPLGFLAWGAGILPLAWSTTSRPLLYLATAVLIAWTGATQAELSQYNWLFPAVMLLAVLPLARRSQTRLAESAVLGSIFLWYMLNVVRLELTYHGAAPTLLVGRLVLLYGATIFLAGLARLGDAKTYLGSGGLLGLLGLYLLTFETYSSHGAPALFELGPYTLGGVTVMLIGAGLAGWYHWRRGETLLLLPAAFVPVMAVLLPDMLMEAPRMVVFNLLLFGGSVGLVIVGIQKRLELLINLGVVAFLIHLITRYFDLFFTAMNKSLFFVLGGILLLAGGWFLERNRRRWVGDWGGGEGDA